MTPDEILTECARAGGSLTLADGSLKCAFPRGALAPELRAEIAEHKPEIIALLEAEDKTRQQQGTPGGPISHVQDDDKGFHRPEGGEAHSGPPTLPQAHAHGAEQVIEYERKPGLRPCSSCDGRYFWEDRAGGLHCLFCEDPEGRTASIERGGALTWKLWEADMLIFPSPPPSTGAEPASGAEAPRAVQQELFQ
jgi:hypothetical protein